MGLLLTGLNGGVGGYSPSNYLNTERIALKSGLQFDEAIVFIDISDVQDEAGLVHDIDESGAVELARHQYHYRSWYSKLRLFISKYLVLTNYVWEFFERLFVGFGHTIHAMTAPAASTPDVMYIATLIAASRFCASTALDKF